MIVPAAGAILTIIQGLMAAWSTVSSILSAFSKFWAYLKAVKAGPAACLFAEAVAAGVVALLDFITNFLLQRLSRATKGVGKRLKGMAQKIMDGLKKVGGGAKKAAGSAVNSARGAVRKARQVLGRPGTEHKPKGHPSPDPKTPVKPKDHATPKGPAKKPDEAATKPRDTKPQESKPEHAEPGRDKAPSKKPKQIEGPKPTKPRKPKSPVGKALSKAKGAVKSALKKAGNAAKTLGRKLKKSKLGKALKKGASKLRNFFKKKKDQFRDHKKRQQEQKRKKQDQRKKDEKSKESKEARLRKIIARLRPKLRSLLAKGVMRPVLLGALAAMRVWYRLTALDLRGEQAGEVLARLNPEDVPARYKRLKKRVADPGAEEAGDKKSAAGAAKNEEDKQKQEAEQDNAPSANAGSTPMSRAQFEKERPELIEQVKAAELDEKGKFRDRDLEAEYKKYQDRKEKQRKRRADATTRDRADWKVTRDYWRSDSPMARGNAFNKTVERLRPEQYHEVNVKPNPAAVEALKSGTGRGRTPKDNPTHYRVDSYEPPDGEQEGKIISRKAIDFDVVEPAEFDKYLNEILLKYSRGTEINSVTHRQLTNKGKRKASIGDGTLQGNYYLEVPETNRGLPEAEEFEKMAKAKEIEILYTPEHVAEESEEEG
jgi:hypothetical protein